MLHVARLGSLVIAHGLVAALCLAADEPVISPRLKQLSLEELMQVKVVTATQIETLPFQLPFMTEAYTRSDYQEMQPRTLPQWLNEVTGVMVQKTAPGQNSPYLRGFTGFRTLLLIDGIRLNNSVFREGPNQYWTTVDPLSVDRLEVVKGPASVLYGSDSIGGTVNALTIGGRDDHNPTWAGRTTYRYSSAEDSQVARAEVAGPLTKRARLSLGGTLKTYGELRGGPAVGRQPHTDYDEYDLDGKFAYAFRPNVEFVAAHQTVSQDDVWRAHSTPFGNTWLGLSHGTDSVRSTDQLRHLTYAQLHATKLPGFIEELHISLSDHVQNEDQTRVRSNRARELAITDVTTFGATVQAQSPSPVGRFVYGATFYRDWVDSSNLRFRADGSFDRADVQGQVADDSTYDLVGCYMQDQLPAWGPLQLTLRGRYDHADLSAGRILDTVTSLPTSFAHDWNSVVGSVRATWRGGSHWLAFAGVSQGFRAPNLSDVSRLDSITGGQIETPSTNVNPEYYVMQEVGAKAHYDRADFAVSYFHTNIQGMIFRRPTGRIFNGAIELTKLNSGTGYVEGVELEAEGYFAPQWKARGAFSWMEGSIASFPTTNPTVSVREPLSRMMPLTTHLAVRYEARRTCWAELVCTTASRQDRLSAGDVADTERIPRGGTPGYTVFTLRSGWRVRHDLSFTLILENLTNRDYRVHGSGFNEPGRNLVLSGTFDF